MQLCRVKIVEVGVALDTNAYADWKKGVRWQQEISEADEVHISVPVLGELFCGFAVGNRQVENLAELESFVDAPSVQVDLIMKETVQCFGDLKKYLRMNGTSMPDNDIWIAAACM